MRIRDETLLRRRNPPMDLTGAADGLPPARLVLDDGAVVDPLAHLYVAEDGGAIRTLIGSAHRHWYSLIPSVRTGRWQPVESEGEEMLAHDSECEFKVLAYRTQAARLRMATPRGRREWIIDHLRQLRGGIVEAIEVKPVPQALDAEGRLTLIDAARVLGRLGWRVGVRFHEEIRGSAARQINRMIISDDGDVSPCEDALAAFDRLMAAGPETTLGALSDALPGGRHHRDALARSFMVAGRVDFDMDEHLQPNSRIFLHETPSFVSRIDLA